MKKNILLLSIFFLTIVIFSSCNDNKNNIIGKWKLEHMNVDAKTSDSVATAKIIYSLIKDGKIDADGNVSIFEFTADGKVSNSNGISSTYTVSENKMIMEGEGLSGVYDWEMKGDSLFISSDFTKLFEQDEREILGIADSVKIEKIIPRIVFVRQ